MSSPWGGTRRRSLSTRARRRRVGHAQSGRPRLEQLEERVLLSGLDVIGTSGDDVFLIRRDPLNTSHLQVLVNNTEQFNGPAANVDSVHFSGLDGSDVLTIDLQYGPAIPAEGIDFDGGAGSDELVLTGATADIVEHRFGGPDSGQILIIDGETIFTVSYVNLEPIYDGTVVPHRVFSFTGGAETITFGDDGDAGDGESFIDSTLSESVTFKNPTASLTINASPGSGPDTFMLNSPDSTFDADVVVLGTNTGDVFNLGGMAGSSNTYTLQGLVGDDQFDVPASGVSRPIDVDGGPGADTLSITGSAADESWIEDIETGQVSGLAGGSAVTHTATETLMFDTAGGSDSLTVLATGNNDALVFTPAATSGTSILEGFDTSTQDVATVEFTGVETSGFLVDGNGGADTLQVNTLGEDVKASADSIAVGSRVAARFMNIASGSLVGGLSGLTVQHGATGGSTVLETGSSSHDGAFTAPGGPRFDFADLVAGGTIQINGGTGDDVLVFTHDSSALLDAVIAFDGAGQVGGDSMTLTGTTQVTSQIHAATGSGSGTITLDGITTIQYAGLEPIFDDLPAANLMFSTPADQADSVAYENGASATDTHQIRSTSGGFETYEFRNKTNVTLDTGTGAADGADTVTLATTQTAAGLAALAVLTGAGGDSVTVSLPFNGGANLTSLQVDGEDGIDLLTVNGPAGSADSYTINNTSVAVAGQQTTSFAGVEQLVVNTGSDDDSALVSLEGPGIPGSILVDGGPGTVALTVSATSGDDDLIVTPTDPTMGGDTVVAVAGVSTVRGRSLFGNAVRLTDGGGDDSVNVVARSTAGQGGAPEVADGDDSITISGDGAGSDQVVTITNASQGPLAAVVLADDNFTEGLTVTAGNETASDAISVVPNVDRPVTVLGGQPAFPVLPGDSLTVDLSGTAGAALTVTGPGSGRFTFSSPHEDVRFNSIETVQATGGTYGAILDVASVSPPDTQEDTIELRLNDSGTAFEVRVNGALVFSADDDAINSFTVLGSADPQKLKIVESAAGLPGEAGGFAGTAAGAHTNAAFLASGLNPTHVSIAYVGNGGEDTAELVLATTRNVAYFSDNAAAPNSGVINVAEALTFSFEGLAPVNFVGAGGALTVDATSSPATTFLTVEDTGLPTDGVSRIVGDGGFETTTFSGFDTIVVRGGDGAETLTLAAVDPADPDGVGPGKAVTAVTLDGDNTTNSDIAADILNVQTLPASVTATLLGGGDDDIFLLDSLGTPGVADGTVDNILGAVTISPAGDEGGTDTLIIDDTGDVGGDVILLTAATVEGITGYAGMPDVDYGSGDQIESIIINSGNFGDTVNIQSTRSGSVYTVNTQGGDDTVNVSSDAPLNTGVLNAIDGQVNINTGTGTGTDALVLSDMGDANGDFYLLTLNGTATEISFGDGDAAVDVRFNVSAPNQLERFRLTAGQGPDTVTNDDADGGDPLQANMLATESNVFDGQSGNDLFEFEWQAGFSLAAGTDLVIHGGSPSSDPANRDVVYLRADFAGDGPRSMAFVYADASKASGDVDVRGLRDGGGIIDVNAVEQLNYAGDSANDDALDVFGTAADDTLSITPVTDSEANVFLDGAPLLTIPPHSPGSNNPGVSGGSAGPDLNLRGGSRTQLFVHGGGSGIMGDRLVVNAPTEDLSGAGTAAGWAGNSFGSSSVVRSADEAFDNIEVTDSLVRITTHNSSGVPQLLIDVNIDTASFERVNPAEAELTVNTGEEAGIRPGAFGPLNGAGLIADDVSVTLSTAFRYQINGGAPPLPAAPPLVGDRLQVDPLPHGNFAVFSDAAPDNDTQVGPNTPNVSITSSAGPITSKPLTYHSIELVHLRPSDATQELDILGDNGGFNPGQQDEVMVFGMDVDSTLPDGDSDGAGELALLLNGSNPIFAHNVRYLNIATAGADDDVTIDPWADDTTGGWAIDVRVDGGSGDDDVIYGNVEYDSAIQPGLPFVDPAPDGSRATVSESVVIAPETVGASGQIRSTNASDGTNILTLDFWNTEDISVYLNDGTAGDTDSLTVLGTAINDVISVDLSAAGDDSAPLIDVDTGSPLIQNLQIEAFGRATAVGGSPAILSPLSSLLISSGSGDDTVSVRGRSDGATAVIVDGGDPSGSDMLLLPGTADGSDEYILEPGAHADEGTAYLKLAGATDFTTVEFGTVEQVSIDGGGGTGTDSLTVEGTDGADSVTLTATAPYAGALGTSFGPAVSFTGMGSENSVAALLMRGGDDQVSITHLPAWGIGTVVVDAGDPFGSDSVEIAATTGDDEAEYTPTAANGGILSLTSGALTTTYWLANVEDFALDGLAEVAADALTVSTFNAAIEPGAEPGSGAIESVDVFGNRLLPLAYRDFEQVRIEGNTALIQGTDDNDSITLRADGTVVVTDPFGNQNSVDVSAFTSVVLNARGGDDSIVIEAGVAFEQVTVIGGDNGTGSDSLSIVGTPGDDNLLVDLPAALIDLNGVSVSLDGIEDLSADLDTGDDAVTVLGLGTPTGLESLAVAFDPSDGDSLNVEGTSGPDTLEFSPSAADQGTISHGGSPLAVRYTGLHSDATLTVGGAGGFDVLLIAGTEGPDVVTTPTSTSVELLHSVTFNTVERLDIMTYGGDDNVTLTNAIALPKVIDVGSGNDRVSASLAGATDPIIYGGPGDDHIFGSPGSDLIFAGAGNDVVVGQGGDDTIYGEAGDDLIQGGDGDDWLFGGEGADRIHHDPNGHDNVDGGPGLDTLLVRLTDANETLRITTGTLGGALVWTSVTSTSTLGSVEAIDASLFGGDDDVFIGDLTGTDVANIDVGVGLGDDSVEIHGSPANDEITVVEQGTSTFVRGLAANVRIGRLDAGETLTLAGGAGNDTVLMTGIAPTVIVDEAAGIITGVLEADLHIGGIETLDLDATGIASIGVVQASAYIARPGPTIDSGSVVADAITLNYRGLQPLDTLILASTGPADSLVVYGTPDDDTVVASGSSVHLLGRAPINMPSIESVSIRSAEGDDLINVSPASNTSFSVQGGDPSASDTLVFNGTGTGAVTVDLGSASVTEVGLQPVTFTGIETVSVDAASQDLSVIGTISDDSIVVQPLTGSSGQLWIEEGGPLLTYSGLAGNALTVSAGFGEDRLTVRGTSAGEVFTASGTSVTVGGQTVNFTAEALAVLGLEGDDTFDVTPSPTVPIFVDGGDPIGQTSGDTLNVNALGPVTVEDGPEPDEGGIIDGANQRVSFDHIEEVNVAGGGGGGPVIVVGTNADDSITVIARDSSTHPGADGVQDFTVAVNAGPDILFLDFPAVEIYALAGSDEIVVRTPAPNDAEWDVDVTIYGGPPSASDRLVVETPGQDNVVYTPGLLPDSGTLLVDEALNDSLITIAGVEEFVYDGEAGNDRLQIRGTGRILHRPGAQVDSGAVLVGSALPLAYQQLGTGGRVELFGQSASDTLAVEGTPDDDAIQLSFSGTDAALIAVGTSAGTHVSITTSGVESYEIRPLDGDDEVGIQGPVLFTGSFSIHGSTDGGSTDALRLYADPANAQSIVIQPDAVRTEEQDIFGFGTRPLNVSGVELIAVEGAGTDDDLTVDLGSTGSEARVHGASPSVVTSDSLPRIEFRNILTFTARATAPVPQTITFEAVGIDGANFYLADGGAFATLVVEGADAAADGFTVADPVGPAALAVTHTSSGVVITEPNGGLGRAIVSTLGGDDVVTVDVGTTGQIDVPLTIEGGAGYDELILTGTPAPGIVDETIYSVGNQPDSGRIVLEDVANNRLASIDFVGLEPVQDNVPAALLTINATDADNAINLVQGPGGFPFVGTTNVVSIDNFETYEFNNKQALLINGLAGSDTVNLNNGGVAAAGLLSIRVDGGDPTGSDRVIVNGTAAADTVNYSPASSGGGAFTGVQGVTTVSVGFTEELLYNGQGGDDTLTVTTPPGPNQIAYRAGSQPDAGSVRVDSLLPLEFVQLGSHGTVHLANSGGLREDQLLYTATETSDELGIDGPTSAIAAANGFLGVLVPVFADGVEQMIVNMLSGDDFVQVVAPAEFSVRVLGGDPDASDFLSISATAGPDAIFVNLGSRRVTSTGLDVSYLGVEEVLIHGEDGTDSLEVRGTIEDDTLYYRPTAADGGEFWLDGTNTVLTFRSIEDTFLVDLDPLDSFADELVLIGTNNHDVITIDSPNRRASVENAIGTVLKPVDLAAGVESITAQAGLGNDTFLVIPAPATAFSPDGQPYNLSVSVDGGPPGAGDALVVAQAGGAPLPDSDFVIVYHSRQPDEGRVRVYRNAVAMPDIAYTDVEIVSPITAPDPGPDENLLIAGPDLYEENQFRATAAFLGSGEVINVENLVIFPNWGEHRFVPADEDWFRVVAEQTGTLDFQVYFRTFDPALLPAGGNLEIEVYDSDGDLVAGWGPNFGTNDADDDERIRIPAVAGQTYYLRVFGAPAGAPFSQVVNAYDMTIINTPAPVPYDIELDDTPVDPAYDCDNDPPSALNSDTGRSQFDNVTCDNSPAIVIRLDDDILREDLPGNPGPDSPPDEVIPIPFNPSIDPANTDPGFRVAVFIEGDPQQPGQDPQVLVGYAQPGAVDGVYVFDFDDAFNGAGMDLTDGSHFISAKVEIIDPANPAVRGYGSRSESLEIVVDTVKPPVAFGEPTVPDDGLHPDSDTGIEDQPDTFIDRITSDTTPTFWGIAEANSIIRVYADTNGNGTFDEGTDLFLGETVAVPLDGSNQFPRGLWEFTTEIDMNDPRYFPEDGLRRIFVTAEDLAGNVSDAEQLDIFIDTRGPRVWNIEYVPLDGSPNVPVFTPKPLAPIFGPTPLTQAIDITFRDEPVRVDGALGFVYPAVNEILATTPGNYRLVGDANGHILITDVDFLDFTVAGDVAWTTVRLHFATPLPDDRFTLTIFDRIADRAGNKLDGDVQATGPGTSADVLPSGDGVPGENFSGRFTVDSRPEIGVFNDRLWFIDLNGNGIFDPTNQDATNRDIVWRFGEPGDWPVVGDWDGDGFDEIGVYGFRGSTYQFELDVNGNGTLDAGDAVFVFSGQNAQPVAGDWNNDGVDEVGLFLNRTWWLDLDGDFVLDAGETIATNMAGFPVAADWDGDGDDDVGVYVTNTNTAIPTNRWILDLNDNFQRDPGDLVIKESPPLGGRKRPVAADWNARGTGKIGLFKVNPKEREAEWLLDVDRDGRFEPPPTGTPGIPLVDQDIFYRFGDRRSEPVVGNFDPPPQGVVESSIPVVTEDPGNGPKQAYRLPFDGGTILVAADISAPSDRDWYVFRAPASGRIAVDVTTPMSELDPMVLVRQGRTTVARNGDFKGTVDSHVEFQVQKGRTYRILVRPQRQTAGSYVLELEYLTPAKDDHGGGFANATLLERVNFGVHTMFVGSGSTERARDRDMFALDIDRDGTYRLSIDNLSPGFHTVVMLFDASRNRLVRFDTAEPEDPTRPNEVIVNLQAGRYYVLVQGHAGLRGDYDLIVDEAVADVLDELI